MDFLTVNQSASLIPFLFCVGIFGGIFKAVTGVIGKVFGGGTTTSSSANFQTLYEQSRQEIYNLQSQLAQKKEMNWTPIILIGGMVLVAIFLFKR